MRGPSWQSRTRCAAPELLQALSGSHSESAFPAIVVHSASRELAREGGMVSAVVKHADRGKLAEEYDHGLSSVHKGLARPMMARNGIGPK
jgi:hypothetical protein